MNTAQVLSIAAAIIYAQNRTALPIETIGQTAETLVARFIPGPCTHLRIDAVLPFECADCTWPVASHK